MRYLVLSVVLGIAQANSSSSFGISTMLSSSIAVMTVYYTLASLLFFGVMAVVGPLAFRWLGGLRCNIIENRYPAAARLLFLLAIVMCCVGLGSNPIFGALMVGLAASRGDAASPNPALAGRRDRLGVDRAVLARVLHPDLLRHGRHQARSCEAVR